MKVWKERQRTGESGKGKEVAGGIVNRSNLKVPSMYENKKRKGYWGAEVGNPAHLQYLQTDGKYYLDSRQVGMEDVLYRTRRPLWLRLMIDRLIEREPIDEKAWNVVESAYHHQLKTWGNK